MRNNSFAITAAYVGHENLVSLRLVKQREDDKKAKERLSILDFEGHVQWPPFQLGELRGPSKTYKKTPQAHPQSVEAPAQEISLNRLLALAVALGAVIGFSIALTLPV